MSPTTEKHRFAAPATLREPTRLPYLPGQRLAMRATTGPFSVTARRGSGLSCPSTRTPSEPPAEDPRSLTRFRKRAQGVRGRAPNE
jgi:hypothetical protein